MKVGLEPMAHGESREGHETGWAGENEFKEGLCALLELEMLFYRK